MFVGNLTPLLIITAACGIEAGGELQVALLQNAMLIAGIVTLEMCIRDRYMVSESYEKNQLSECAVSRRMKKIIEKACSFEPDKKMCIRDRYKICNIKIIIYLRI